jgi:hypothetical protein
MPPDQLTPEARRTLAAQDKYFVAADRGIKGDLRKDGRVELYGGTHRAGYMLERGVDPIPVWVSDGDPQRLAAFRAQCHDEVQRTRPGIIARDQPRTQITGPENERTREKAVTRGERDA